MNKHGLWSTLKNMVIALLVIAVLIYFFTDQAGIFQKSINQCTGVCVQQGRCQQGNIIYQGKGACGKGKVCCDNKRLEQQRKDAQLPVGSQAIQVRVAQRVSTIQNEKTTNSWQTRPVTYTNQDTIPKLYVGQVYRFSIKTNAFPNHVCQVYLKNDNNDNYVYQGDKPLIAGKSMQTSCNNLKLNVPVRERYPNKDLELDVIVYNKSTKDQIASAKLYVEATSPIDISFDTNWKSNHEATVTCQTGCTKGLVALPKNKKDCTGALVARHDFTITGDSHTVQLNNSKLHKAMGKEFESPLCVSLKTGMATPAVTSENMLKHDVKPPSLSINKQPLQTREQQVNVTCNDASGCEELHYMFIRSRTVKTQAKYSKITQTEIDQIGSLIQDLRKNTDPSACPPPMAGKYRIRSRTRTNDDTYGVSVQGKLYGAICVYGVDKAGNVGKPELTTFVNQRGIWERTIGDITIGDVLNALAS